MLHFYRNERYGYINRNNEPNKRYFVVLNQLNIKMTRYYNKYVDNDNSPYNYLRTFVYVQNHNSKNNNNINIKLCKCRCSPQKCLLELQGLFF